MKPAPTRLRPLCVLLVWLPLGPALAQEREKPREFLDSLADNALAPDRNAIYRRDGKRREIDLGDGIEASLDEAKASFLSNPRGTPGGAGVVSRVIGISARKPSYGYDLSYGRSALGRRAGLSGGWRLGERVVLYADVHENRSEIDDLPGTPSTRLRRRDSEFGLRWRSADGSTSTWTTDLALHQSRLAPDPASALVPEATGEQLVWRGRLEPASWPGLSLMAQLNHVLGREPAPSTELSGHRIGLGADWRLADGWGPLPAGSLLAWRESPRLGLLGDDEALTLPAAYRRSIGLELPDGSGRGHVYTQLRHRSLADRDDALGVLGWQRNWAPWPRWGLDTQLEQAVPLAGRYPIRATQAGGRLSTSRFPRLSFSTALDLVNASTSDSAYHEIKLTQRLADDWLGALRLSVSRSQPHGNSAAGSTDYKGALALGWREPQARALHLLSRMTWSGREVDAGVPASTSADRRARIWLGHAGYLFDDHHTLTVRLSHRTARDETRLDGNGLVLPHRTQFWLTRWIWEQDREGDQRWSLSAHVAGRSDNLDGAARAWGAELGYRVSSKAALTLGYNPRGFADNEITVEERPRKGFTLRLRFTIEGALARWLDNGRSGTATPWSLPDNPPAGLAPSLDRAQEQSAAGF
ncbi:hypothetical protein Lcho_0537 [Leptothrix cholodnii SP-6]|uniref:TonB-dependent receptor n=1 Tax=Leptothrix cholodnii (strain ATCC 51168 / LMG 8142 / SP-6) TaxID=395495 RepID=B1XYS8_LEPCP|nr:hypothetical protein [Leptothrix cholodnii]ACB32812.1 hypothetical protein Lcho_0537 [Leptothrix cholodnii SP-6]